MQQLEALLAWESVSDDHVNHTVNDIITTIRNDGDHALMTFTSRFDRWQPASPAALEIPRARLGEAWNSLADERRVALQKAADRIRAYAERQKLADWAYLEDDDTLLGQQVTPLDRVGLVRSKGSPVCRVQQCLGPDHHCVSRRAASGFLCRRSGFRAQDQLH